MSKIILCDVDGVVADLHPAWLELYNFDYGDTLKPEQVDRWEFHELVDPRCGKKIYDYLRDPRLYEMTKPVEGALAGVEFLRSLGHRVVFVSSCAVGSTDAKMEWLQWHGFLPADQRTPDDFVAAHSKSLVLGDLLIDDAAHNVLSFYGQSILVDAPYNRHVEHPRRAKGWSGIIYHAGGVFGM